jgi:hypothetical protein
VTAMVRAYWIFWIGTNWKKIMMKWRELEDALLKKPYEKLQFTLKHRIRLSFAIAIGFGIRKNIFVIY